MFLGAFLGVTGLAAPGEESPTEPDLRIAGPVSTKQLLIGVVHAMKEDKGLNVAIRSIHLAAKQKAQCFG